MLDLVMTLLFGFNQISLHFKHWANLSALTIVGPAFVHRPQTPRASLGGSLSSAWPQGFLRQSQALPLGPKAEAIIVTSTKIQGQGTEPRSKSSHGGIPGHLCSLPSVSVLETLAPSLDLSNCCHQPQTADSTCQLLRPLEGW